MIPLPQLLQGDCIDTLSRISEGSVDLGLTGETLTLSAGVHVLNVDTPDGTAHSRIRVTVTSGKLTRVLAGLKPR